MILPIVVIGHPVLRMLAKDIDRDYPGLEKLVADMTETMNHAEGVGLAAPQIGHSIRLFVIDAAPMAEDDESLQGFKGVFYNAKIVEKGGQEIIYNEGCLSIPGIREDVKRYEKITLDYYDENWQFKREEFTGTKAWIIQHEYDHIEGVLFVDFLSPLRKRLIRSKLSAISKGRHEARYRTVQNRA